MLNIGFIGIGKLGQDCAEVMAEKNTVVGFDLKPRTPANFKMADTISEAVKGRDLVFIAVETPHDEAYGGTAPTSHLPPKDFSYHAVQDVLREVSKVADSGQRIVLISTVLPGTTREQLAPLVPNQIFIYNPYLIAMGTTKWDMRNPEMIMIGTETGSSDEIKDLVRLYNSLASKETRFEIGTWEECECIKVFYNTFISTKIALVNMIQDVAIKLGNTNSEMICDALSNSTKRIMGATYMKPGMGDGGACHPRDNIALRFLAKKMELDYDLFDSIMEAREKQARNMALFLINLDAEMPIVICGKTYKPLVPFTDGSSSILVAHYVELAGRKVYFSDPLTGDSPPEPEIPSIYLLAHDPVITYGDQLGEIEINREVAHHDDRTGMSARHSKQQYPCARGSFVVDPWRKFPKIEGINVIHYGNTRK